MDLTFNEAAYNLAAPFVKRHHYSHAAPGAMRAVASYGVFAPGGLFGSSVKMVACCMFSLPTTVGWSQGGGDDTSQQPVELSRLVRLDDADFALSSFVSWSLRSVKHVARARGLPPVVVSYADSGQNHHGGIYQACSFLYVGIRGEGRLYGCEIGGRVTHRRSLFQLIGTSSESVVQRMFPGARPVLDKGKHLYVFPFGKAGRRWVAERGLVGQNYPKPDQP